jgi:hypothetical protein
MWAYNQTPPNTLQHWGIPGMKWGVRRYQNKDGTLTPAGKKKYGDSEKEGIKEKVKEMSDEDLRKFLNRLQMEKQVSQLLSETEAPKVAKGKKLAREILESSGKIAATKIAASLGKYFGDKIVDKLTDKSDSKKAKEKERTEKAKQSKDDSAARKAAQDAAKRAEDRGRSKREKRHPRANRHKTNRTRAELDDWVLKFNKNFNPWN